MKGFYIEISNGLLEPKHQQSMGSAVWEFMWCLNKMTLIKEDYGWVLSKKPIKLEEIAKDIGKARNNISQNLIKLEKSGYLELTHAPYGIIIKINKAKKRFNQKVEPRFNENVEPRNVSVEPNKDKTVDKTGTAEFKSNFKPIKLSKPNKAKGHILAQAKQVCQIFSDNLGGFYVDNLQLPKLIGLLEIHGIDMVSEVALFACQLKDKPYQVKVNSPAQLADKWSQVIKLMDNPDGDEPPSVVRQLMGDKQ